ncbi:MAG: hypothetical protein A2504_02480 [Bdellovibrionales bacterium RIFOXYD12_FULL_39_22]|nr:MAG: hypothetical protein A2385_12510 [Bdellovibrionales bacterium RIFOXYB1_FULL_39_21]OFZ41171.1 MAG: hypothetical protein A2485_00920 [Bdellovibrionales bacterium RIFOXYC12_FULL_39_17]OFZ44925.1 MAG: hypothetical protein A2404_11665 [Bdellovibrionales bacterium RIFOXYC1_FULL_39_130]OFZ73155.1 MAG: hypothetical protein A2451_11945 [Bdellovibrionales bacterium RIFOXYC2_FULL_39_8]OFZ74372.1 MAG: hypothetical protein A2560_12035 [Bdellovibrionales bacterium RIFOXYD1_FULL_39_84]OFZ92374.1 MAG:
MRKSCGFILIVLFASIIFWPISALYATPGYQQAMMDKYPDARNGQLNNCATCHLPLVADFLNNYGLALRESVKQGGKVDFDFASALDSDGDGVSNIDEISKQSFPGSQASGLDQFEFTNNRGAVSFDHASHSVNSAYMAFGKCQVCHFPEGFPKTFEDKVLQKTLAHKLCLGCHKEQHAQGNTNPPKQCAECHN